MHTGFRWESQKYKDHWEDPDVDRRIILKWILQHSDGVVIWNTGSILWSVNEGVNH
jgi:hypothetical protein